ncbi:MAG: GNAT family N-acetyltransferase [Ruminiclostridium sp.]|nr:GNAT family N-acetyltransferase [Ruminiclostridium sp.]
MNNLKVIEITPDNILDIGMFCGSEDQYKYGINRKARWFEKRYKEGLRIKISVNEEGIKTGMIEYVPGEFTWRTIRAKGYTVIHCLYVLRRQTRKGYGSYLLNECIKDSEHTNGIAVVTSSKPWVNDKKYFLKNGFKKIENAPPYFELFVKQFKEAPLPGFNKGWEERALIYGDGLTVIYSDQCPIIDYALNNIIEASKECNMDIKFHKIETHLEAQNAPSPYGVFNVIINGKFITHRIFNKQRYVEMLKSGQV